jgi:hypothetical protein
MAVRAGDHIQHTHGFRDDFRPDAIAREQSNFEIQVKSPMY